MVSATRAISCRTEVSRSGVFGLPWKYFEVTMFVAVCDQDFGTSTPSWRKIVWPFSLPISAVRRSHSTASNGETLPAVKNRRNSRPVRGRVPAAVSIFSVKAILASDISASAQEGSPEHGEPFYFTPKCVPEGPQCLILQQAPLDPEGVRSRARNAKKRKLRPCDFFRPPGWIGNRKLYAGAHRLTGAGDGRQTPLLSRLNPGTERGPGRPSRCFGTASGPNCAPPNLSGQYTRWAKVVKKKNRASTKYLIVRVQSIYQ